MALSTMAARRKDLTAGMANMQHRHFATIAAIIRDMREDGTMSAEDVRTVAEHFASKLDATNENFNRKRFLAACDA